MSDNHTLPPSLTLWDFYPDQKALIAAQAQAKRISVAEKEILAKIVKEAFALAARVALEAANSAHESHIGLQRLPLLKNSAIHKQMNNQ